MSEGTLITIQYIQPPHTMVTQYKGHGHEWSTHIPFVPCQSALPFLKQGYFKLWLFFGTSRLSLWIWWKGKTIQSAQDLFDLLFFSFHSNQKKIPEIQLFWHLTLKNLRARSWVRSKVKSHISPSIQPMHPLLFHINRTNHSWDMSNRVFDLEKTHPIFLKNIHPNKSCQQNFSRY